MRGGGRNVGKKLKQQITLFILFNLKWFISCALTDILQFLGFLFLPFILKNWDQILILPYPCLKIRRKINSFLKIHSNMKHTHAQVELMMLDKNCEFFSTMQQFFKKITCMLFLLKNLHYCIFVNFLEFVALCPNLFTHFIFLRGV